MFHNCFSLSYFPQLNWNISNVQDMSFMFHNFPLYLIHFQWNFFQLQNTIHMFTNFDSYSSSNFKINVFFDNSLKRNKVSVLAFKEMLCVDLIDKFLWKSQFIDYKENKLNFLYNGKPLKKNLTLLESEIHEGSTIVVFDKGS